MAKIRIFTVLKKLIAIFLLLQVVSNNAFAEELIKLPSLFTHFYHHATEHKDIDGFFDFLHKHYSDHHQDDPHAGKHKDEDKHCNLPFKHCHDGAVNAHAPAPGFVPAYLTTAYNFILIKSVNYTSENDRILSNDLCSIWQPPRLG